MWTKYKDFFLSRLNLSLFMTLKNFHILFPTKINFLLYLAVILYMRSLAQVVAKHILAWHKNAFLSTRLSSSAVGEHFSVCEHAQYLASLQNQFTLLNNLPLPSDNLSPIEILVLNNYKILHSTKSNNYSSLAFLDALLIKHNKPFLHTGLKASKEVQLFT